VEVEVKVVMNNPPVMVVYLSSVKCLVFSLLFDAEHNQSLESVVTNIR
jgi:hypothetical protein